MTDVQIARCDGGNFQADGRHIPEDSFEKDDLSCSETLELIETEGNNYNYKQKLHFQSHGWVRREFRSVTGDTVRWWSFCPKHVMLAVEQHYLVQFSDDGE